MKKLDDSTTPEEKPTADTKPGQSDTETSENKGQSEQTTEDEISQPKGILGLDDLTDDRLIKQDS